MDERFTQEPSNPSYFNNGSDAKLMWDYTGPYKVDSITYSVLVVETFFEIMVNDSRGAQEHPKIPDFYKGRVKVEGRATLVIKNISPKDNTQFKCEMRGTFVKNLVDTVQLIVAGTYYRNNH